MLAVSYLLNKTMSYFHSFIYSRVPYPSFIYSLVIMVNKKTRAVKKMIAASLKMLMKMKTIMVTKMNTQVILMKRIAPKLQNLSPPQRIQRPSKLQLMQPQKKEFGQTMMKLRIYLQSPVLKIMEILNWSNIVYRSTNTNPR